MTSLQGLPLLQQTTTTTMATRMTHPDFITIVNDPTLHEQQTRIVQALCGSEIALHEIRNQPTSPQSLRTWRHALQNPDERFERHAQVILVLVLEDMLRKHPHLRWKDLQSAWKKLLAPSSMMHLVVDANMFHLQDGEYLEPEPGVYAQAGGKTLWTLATRIDRTLRLRTQPISIAEDRPCKRRRVVGPPPTQQAVTTVLLAFLAAVDPEPDVTQWMADYSRRWSILTAGWTKLEESLWLAAWNTTLQQRTADAKTVLALLQKQTE